MLTLTLRLIYLKRDDVEFILLQKRDEVRGDVRPAIPNQTISPVLSKQVRNTIKS